MNAKECLTHLSAPLRFGDAVQIAAHKTLERIYVARDAIAECSAKHFAFSYSLGEISKVDYLESFEEEVFDCDKCKEKLKAQDALYADELLAAIAILFEEGYASSKDY